jgi:hypothetical protein
MNIGTAVSIKAAAAITVRMTLLPSLRHEHRHRRLDQGRCRHHGEDDANVGQKIAQ